MIKHIQAYKLLVASLLLHLNVSAQNNSSPYSVIGIGDIEESNFNRTTGMANTGLAYRSAHFLILNNPASYSALQNQFFIVEAGGRGKFTNYYGNNLGSNSTKQSRDFSVNRFSIGIKVNNWWGSSAGIMPYSTSNYSFSGKKIIQGTSVHTYADYEGSGGVNKVYWGNGFRIGKHFSVGVSASYLFGSLNQKETLAGSEVTDEIITTNNIFLRNLQWDMALNSSAKSTKNGT